MRKLLCLLLFVFIGYCEIIAQIRQLPIDTTVRVGRLPNGLTYYIRSTSVAPGRGSFYLIQNVGALLENDRQNGMAHFLEHIAFQGSAHFPGRSMVQMLERKGLTYGKEISAYTSLNETLYGLNHVPLENGMTDSCLLVLYDWSHRLDLDSLAVVKERPVILAEWRTRRDADFRLKEKTAPQLYAGSRYGVRDIIGDTVIIGAVNASNLREFYRTWYRPDLQALAVVGDFNSQEMEQKIVALFSDIPLIKEAPARPFIEIPLDRKFAFVQATDPEAARGRIEVRMIQRGGAQNEEIRDARVRLKTELLNRLMRDRMYESFRINKIPAIGVALLRTTEQRGYNALILVLLPKPGYEEKVLEAAWTEKERMKRFGFTTGEIKRAKSMLLRELEAAALDYEKQPAELWVEKISRHFLEGIPMDDPQEYLKYIRTELSLIDLFELMNHLKLSDEEELCSVSVTGPTNMKKMEAEAVKQLFEKVEKAPLQPFVEGMEEYALTTQTGVPGKVVKEKSYPEWNAEEWTLSNGAKVILCPVANHRNQITCLAYRKGGMALYDRDGIAEASLLPMLMDYYGVGELNASQLNKILTERGISSNVIMKPWYAGIGGQAPDGELETLLQILWLRFEHPRFDSVLHKMVINKLSQQLQERSNNSTNRISDTLSCVLGNYNPRLLPLTSAQVAQVTLEQVKKRYEESFADGADFTFVFTGNISPEILKPLAEKYIGSLSQRKEKTNLSQDTWPKSPKKVKKEVILPLSSPRSTVMVNYAAEMKYSLENKLYNQLVRELLETRSMERLRMQEGATYQVVVQEAFEAHPVGKSSLMLYFDCEPGREKELAAQVETIVSELAAQGPSADELSQAMKKIQTRYDQEKSTPAYWTNVLFSWGMNGINEADEQIFRNWLEQQKTTDIRRYMKKLLTTARFTELIFRGGE